MIADAAIKPVTTGKLIKLVRNPRRNIPNASRNKPLKSASIAAATNIFSGLKLLLANKLPSAVAVIIDVIAKGPTDNGPLEPNKA